MFFLLALFALKHTLSSPVSAVPLRYNFFRDVIEGATTSVAADCSCPDKRSTWDIIWSCLSTIFACTWVAVHPNMPSPREGWRVITTRRISIMLYAAIAPDMVIYWALRQWGAAKEISETYKDRGWTMVHGFFLQMGGFRLHRPDGTSYPLWFEHFQDLLKEGKIDFPILSEEDIQDKSKGDVFAKGIAVFHTAWFIVQCIARGTQGLDVTELEIVTVGFAALNGLMYYLWWHKPLDVQRAYPVYLKQEPPALDEKPEAVEASSRTSTGQESAHVARAAQDSAENTQPLPPPSPGHQDQLALEDLRHQEPLPIEPSGQQPPPISPSEKTNVKAVSTPSLATKASPSWPIRFLLALYRFIYRFISILIRPFADMATQLNVQSSYDRVPTFYAYRVKVGMFAAKAVSIMVLVGICYGAVHCIAWAFHFPSAAERILWRVASVAFLGVPVYLFILVLFIGTYDERPNIVTVAKWTAGFGFVVYVVARLALLVLSFTTLRGLPPSAYLTIEWTKFIPHLGSSS